MTRRQLLKLLLSEVACHTLDIDRLLWTKTKTIFIPSNSQVAFFNQTAADKLWEGIPYHQSNPNIGTWLGITRSTEPWPWKELLNKLTIDAKKPLYIIVDDDIQRKI